MTPEQEFYEKLTEATGVQPTAPVEGSAAEKELKQKDEDWGVPVTLRNLFIHRDTHPVVLDFSLLREFGVDWLGWDTPTIWSEIQRQFQTQISEINRAKIQCVKTLHVANGPWGHWQVFEKIVQGLNGTIPKWEIQQVPTLEQLYAAVDMMEHIRVQDFSEEVCNYMAAVVIHEDVFFVPPPLHFIQTEVSQPRYHCRDCGHEYAALYHDGFCDNCTEKFSPEQGLSMRPKINLVEQGAGQNLDIVIPHDPSEVEAKWDKVKLLPSAQVTLEENSVDVQVSKLLFARDWMNLKRKQLADQLTSLKSWLMVKI